MNNLNEVTLKGRTRPDNFPAQARIRVSTLRNCDAPGQTVKAPKKDRRLTPAARKSERADITPRSCMCSKSGQRVKTSVINVDKQKARRLTGYRHIPVKPSGYIVTFRSMTFQNGEAL
jgi:hypothetical protein